VIPVSRSKETQKRVRNEFFLSREDKSVKNRDSSRSGLLEKACLRGGQERRLSFSTTKLKKTKGSRHVSEREANARWKGIRARRNRTKKNRARSAASRDPPAGLIEVETTIAPHTQKRGKKRKTVRKHRVQASEQKGKRCTALQGRAERGRREVHLGLVSAKVLFSSDGKKDEMNEIGSTKTGGKNMRQVKSNGAAPYYGPGEGKAWETRRKKKRVKTRNGDGEVVTKRYMGG